MKVENHNSSIGNFKANRLCLIIYLISIILSFIPMVKYFAWVLPLIFYTIEKKSDFVRKNVMQAMTMYIVLGIILFVVDVVIYSILFSGVWYTNVHALTAVNVITLILTLVAGIFMGVAAVRSYRYEEYKIPLIGDIAFETVASRTVEKEEIADEDEQHE